MTQAHSTHRRYTLWIRWLLILTTSYLLFEGRNDPYGLKDSIILAHIASNCLLAFLPARLFSSSRFYTFLVPADLVFVSLALYLGGAGDEGLYPVFFLAVVIAAISERLGYALTAAAALLTVYCWLVWTAGLPFSPVQLPFLFATVAFVGHLTQPGKIGTRPKESAESTAPPEPSPVEVTVNEKSNTRTLAQQLSVPVFVYSRRRFLYVNPAGQEITGYNQIELKNMDARHLLAGKLIPVSGDEASGTRGRKFQILILTKQGSKRWLEVSLERSVVEGEPAWIGAAADITSRKEKEQELLHSASHDPLTGLPNRLQLLEELQVLTHQSRRGQMFALLYLDLDRFKFVNDALGHAIGDELLIAVSERLVRCLSSKDLAARIGGDEFAIVLRQIDSSNDAMRVADRIHQELSGAFNLRGQEVFIKSSIGVSFTSADAQKSAEDLLKSADTAMYRAKKLGKTHPQQFHTATHSSAAHVLRLENELRQSLERDDFQVYYQPIVCLRRGVVAGFEALVRWNHPVRGLIPPGEFISAAEESGLIIPIGWRVLRQACRQVREWQRRFPADQSLFMNVNLSYRQFMQPDLVQQVEKVVKSTGLEAEHLHLEFTESLILESTESTTVKLLLLKALGVQLVIDDFGTGYTLLSHLNRFPIDVLKIDRSFVNMIRDGSEGADLVKIILNISRTMGARVIAEGIETEGQRECLRSLQCHYGQGFLFGRPLPVDAATAFMEGKLGLASCSPEPYTAVTGGHEHFERLSPSE